MGTGLDLACKESVGRVVGWVGNGTNHLMASKPGPVVGYQDPFLTLIEIFWPSFW